MMIFLVLFEEDLREASLLRNQARSGSIQLAVVSVQLHVGLTLSKVRSGGAPDGSGLVESI